MRWADILNGDVRHLRVGKSGVASDVGPLPVQLALGVGAGATLYSSTVYEASGVVKATSGTLVSISGYNSLGSTQFIQLHNAAAVPANTTVPVVFFSVPASSNFSFDFPLTGLPFTTGIVVCNSSTGPTKTMGAADCFFTVVYI